ncbi:MAG: hypothetical protein GY737_25705 [Desulfobacteraceae bacterium]|nr:hypothetical protein [Desulfobacteraceae bacterium]
MKFQKLLEISLLGVFENIKISPSSNPSTRRKKRNSKVSDCYKIVFLSKSSPVLGERAKNRPSGRNRKQRGDPVQKLRFELFLQVA